MSFREALLKGLAPDGGLYMPSHIPELTENDIKRFRSAAYHEIAYEVLNYFLINDISSGDLKAICSDAYTFDVPVEKVNNSKYILRLDRGPTASFKDFAARMMARLMHHFISQDNLHFTILTATSGDTGSAVASAFHGFRNINVIILFPAGEVSDIQRRQMTTLHDNVNVVAIDGKFDDCQRLVKTAFSDPELADIHLSSANSINIGRLLPQAVYYFYAWSLVSENADENVIFSVPSGNFGNLMGGIIAREMGLPVRKFIISTNSNNEVPEFLRTGSYKTISPSINCMSNAMNVGHPSNLARIVAFYGGIMDEAGVILKAPDIERMRNDFHGVSISEEETRNTIKECYNDFGVILEPHGAVAWKGAEYYCDILNKEKDQLVVSLETAHPAKFRKEVESILGISLPIPDSLKGIETGKEEFAEMKNDYEKLRTYIRRLA